MTLGVVMIVLLVLLTIGWVMLNVFGALSGQGHPPLYWTLLSVGTSFLVMVLVGVVVYLVVSIKAVNLTRRQSNFVDSVTHELKSPITSLKLYLQTLSRYPVSVDEQNSFCNYMLGDVERLDRLVNHLLATARLDKKRVETEMEMVDLSELLSQDAESACLRYRISRDTVKLDLQPIQAWAVRGELELIFGNLIDNAVKYAGKPPQVEITLGSSAADEFVVRIVDNGLGIPRKLRRKVFGRFVRLGHELERETPGTGLGLYIVRTLVHRMKGRVRVMDDDHGVGTVFEVHLPCGDGPTGETPESAGSASLPTTEELDVA
ncbi:MAG: HAMP domain-containing histidine kinase [Planctomycetes bacterium]|nr:HAMP domain-containing histidine kinase [Planctomycetota bacterium]